MAKHSVPKRKQAKARSKQRYSTFAANTRRKLSNKVNLVECKNCGQKRQTHHVCPNCGMYRGRQVLNKDKKMQKITKMQA